MLSNKLNNLADNRAIVLDNITCSYCGCSLSVDSDNTKEHVIGRRFVPKGTLNGCWNLIVRCCRKCNSTKSDLENDISAITLVGKVWFDSSDSEERAINEAQRKSKNSISNKTKKAVIESHENFKIEVPLAPGVNVTFNMTSPPQVEDRRIFELARLQLMAFFYFITYDNASKKGGFWLEGFHPVDFTHHGDWGNDLQKSFMNAVVNWEPRWIGVTADGYFKSIIRRHPNTECWSWALEWNKNYRVIGFFGSRKSAQETFDRFVIPELKSIKTNSNSHVGHRLEVKLLDEEDVLFECKVENA